MPELDLIVSPNQVFTRFVADYRLIPPMVPISTSINSSLASMINDLAAGRQVRVLTKSNPFKRIEAAAPSSSTCSQHLLDFLSFLGDVMKEQTVFRITPTRATELLFNFDFDDNDYSQDVLRLEQDETSDGFKLISTNKYEVRERVRLELTLGCANDATDWTLISEA